MARQSESTHVVDPFIRMMKARGWTCVNIAGSGSQSGLPDYFCRHKSYGYRWIEFKVFPNATSCRVKTTDAQKVVIPDMLACGILVYAICHHDLRGKTDKVVTELNRLYRKLFAEPNAKYLFIPELFHMLR